MCVGGGASMSQMASNSFVLGEINLHPELVEAPLLKRNIILG